MTLIVSRANVDFAAERLQVALDRLTPIRADGDMVSVQPFRFHAIPSAHESLTQDENGDHRFIGFIVHAGVWTIYHSGDCILYKGLVERLIRWKIDLALLPINGSDPGRGVAGNFSPEEAARLAEETHASLVIPCHYEMFEFNTVSPLEFEKAARRVSQSYKVLKCGERLDL
jgi:L-ascorbate metabolism protein UlaG (beta-lactamase superfamily)